MAKIDSTNNYTREELRDVTIAAFDVKAESHFGNRVLNTRTTQRQEGSIRVYDAAYFSQEALQARADKTVAANMDYGTFPLPYSTKVYGGRRLISDRESVNADEALDMAKDASKFLMLQTLKNQDKSFAESLMVSGIWTNESAGGLTAAVDTAQSGSNLGAELFSGANGFYKFSEPTSDPLSVLDEALSTIQLRNDGLRADTVVMPRNVFKAIKKNEQVIRYGINNPISGIAGGNDMTKNIIAQYLDIEVSRVFVIDAVLTTAAVVTPAATIDPQAVATLGQLGGRAPQATEGTVASDLADAAFVTDGVVTAPASAGSRGTGAFIGGANVLLLHVGDSNGKYSPTAAVKSVWTGLFPDGENGNVETKAYRDESLAGDYIEVNLAYSWLVTARTLGYLLTDCI